MPRTTSTSVDALVLVDDTNGITVIPQLSELRRLNWFDGKLLRADDLRVEQDHVRGLVRRANRAGGRGVVDGFTVTLGGDGRLHVSPGTALDPSGRSLLLPVDVALDIGELISKTAGTASVAATGPAMLTASVAGAGHPRAPARTRARPGTIAATAAIKSSVLARATPALTGIAAVKAGFADCAEPKISSQAPVGGGRWYVISVGWAEGLCGNEEVYGRLCEDACTSSTDRPWRIDGLVFRARPITPRTALATSSAAALDARHARSLVASALFEDERDDAGSLIFGAGLRSSVWCAGAPAATARHDEVPLALVERAGDTTTFLDMWTARRERIQTPPRRYWDGRMSMRPWDVFLAQVLQFQCQLSDLLDGAAEPAGPGGDDPCAERQRVLELAVAELAKRPLDRDPSTEDAVLELFKKQVLALRLSADKSGARRVLIDGGIVELPPAGYLPVNPAGPQSVQEQVRSLMGDGIELSFCTTRQDAVARAFEEAQHLDRISLLTGLDNARRRQEVEIIVPDAEILEFAARDGWEGRLQLKANRSREVVLALPPFGPDERGLLALDGAGRVETREALALRWAGAAAPAGDTVPRPAKTPTAFLEASADRDPFTLHEREAVSFSAASDIVPGSAGNAVTRGSLHGTFRLGSSERRPGGVLLRGHVSAIANWRTTGSDGRQDSSTFNIARAPATVLRRRTDDGGAQLVLSMHVDKSIVNVTLTYHGDADTVELAGFVGGAVGTRGLGDEIARLTLQREPGAATPANPARLAAESALRALERAIGEPGYAQDAGQRLFPGGDDAGFRLRATRDWVLFRRRAVLRCGGTVQAPVRTDSFAVYGAVIVPAGERLPRYRHLGEVRFARGSSALAGGSDAVAGAWDDDARGGELVTAGVVAGSPGGDELGLKRIDELVQALSGITKPSRALKAMLLQSAGNLDAHGADGIIVVSAVPAPVGTIAVAVVAPDQQLSLSYLASTNAKRFAEAMTDVFEIPHILGTVTFPESSTAPSKPDELELVRKQFEQQLGGAGVSLVDIYSVTGDAAAGDVATRTGRGALIGEAIGGVDKTRVFAVEDAVFEQARDRGVTQRTLVVVSPLRAVTAAVVAVNPEMVDSYTRRLSSGNVQGALKDAFTEEVQLGKVAFEAGSPKPVSPKEIEAVAENYKSAVNAPARRVDVFTVKDDPDGGDEQTRRGRGRAVEAAVDGAAEAGELFAVSDSVYAIAGVSPERTIILVVPVLPA